MKNNFKVYSLIWVILFAVWLVVAFLVQPISSNYVKYDTRFWIAFAFIVVAFIGNLACAFIAFKADNLKKMFLNLPLITVSWSTLIVMLVVGSVLMLIPNYPTWIAAVLCIIILSFNASAVLKASWAADLVSKVDERVIEQTSFIKNLTIDVESILSCAKSEDVKAECKKVYEAVRYSDPMSNDDLSLIEAKIITKVDELSSAVKIDEVEKVKTIAKEILSLITERNIKCRGAK